CQACGNRDRARRQAQGCPQIQRIGIVLDDRVEHGRLKRRTPTGEAARTRDSRNRRARAQTPFGHGRRKGKSHTMARRLPPLNALRAFEVAARHNSFTGAAEELRVSHAAISRHVRALEARLGVALFHRAKRGVELTAAGARDLQAVSAAFDAIAEATETVAGPDQAQIRVSVHPAFGARWLIRRLDRFREAHPEYEVVLDATPQLIDLARD